MIYLSHIGFPVPAKRFKTTVFDGLFTTINLTDNLNLGYSHFYSEVKRVKDIAVKISSKKNLFIIFLTIKTILQLNSLQYFRFGEYPEKQQL